MGLITSLIAEHQKKEKNDFDSKMGLLTTMLSTPGLKPEAQTALWQNVAVLAGTKLGLPKQHHGMLGQLLTGMSKLNPAPKDDTGKGMVPMPDGKLPGTQNTETGAGGQPLPSAPKWQEPNYSPTYTTDQMREIGDNQVRQDAATKRDIEQQDIDQKIARLGALHASGDISATDYERAVAELQSGVKLPNSLAGTKPKPTSLQIKDADAPDGKRWIPVQQGWDENGSVVYSKLGAPGQPGEPIDPSTILQVGPPPRDYNRNSPHYMDIVAAIKSRNPTATDAEVREAAGKIVEAEEALKLVGQQVNIAGKEQGQNIMSERSGVLPPPARVKLPTFTINSIKNGTTSTAPAAGAGGAKPAVTGAKPAATGTHAAAPGKIVIGAPQTQAAPPKPEPKRKPTPSESVGLSADPASHKPITAEDLKGKPKTSPVYIQHMIDTDPDVLMATSWLLDGAKEEGLKGIDGLRPKRGLAKLMRTTGLTQIQLQEEAKRRADINKQLSSSIGRLEAYGELNYQIDRIGKMYLETRAAIGNSAPRLEAIKIYLKQGWTDDKQYSELVTANNEFSRVYARFASSAAQSTGQTHASAQDAINTFIDPSKGPQQIAGVLQRVAQGAQIDADSYKLTIKAGQKQLQKNWGQLDATDILPKIESGTGNKGGSDGMIQVRMKDGRVGPIHPSQLANFQRDNPGSVVVDQK